MSTTEPVSGVKQPTADDNTTNSDTTDSIVDSSISTDNEQQPARPSVQPTGNTSSSDSSSEDSDDGAGVFPRNQRSSRPGTPSNSDSDDESKHEHDETEHDTESESEDQNSGSSSDSGSGSGSGDEDSDEAMPRLGDSPQEELSILHRALKTTRTDLQDAVIAERSHFVDKDSWDEEAGRPKLVKATSSFWKGSDWTTQEKAELALGQTALTTGLVGGLGTLVTNAMSVMSADEGIGTAEDRMATAGNSTAVAVVDRDMVNDANLSLHTAITGLVNSGVLYFGAVVAGLYTYYNVCAKHAARIEALNRPDVTVRREQLMAQLRYITGRINALNEALQAESQD